MPEPSVQPFTFDLAPTPKRTLPEEAARQICQAIITGYLKQGQRINEVEIAELLQMSRGPVREALAMLMGRGLVKKIANHGMFVVKLSVKSMREIYSLRTLLELFALDLILEKPETLKLEEMEQLVRNMGYASDEKQVVAVLSELDTRFHAALVASAGHERLLEAWNNLRPQIQLMLYSSNILNTDYRSMAICEHTLILEALRAKDETLVKQLLKDHLHMTYERLCANYISNEEDK